MWSKKYCIFVMLIFINAYLDNQSSSAHVNKKNKLRILRKSKLINKKNNINKNKKVEQQVIDSGDANSISSVNDNSDFVANFYSIFIDFYYKYGHLYSLISYFFDLDLAKIDRKIINVLYADLNNFFNELRNLLEFGFIDMQKVENDLIKNNRFLNIFLKNNASNMIYYKDINCFNISIDENSSFEIDQFFQQIELQPKGDDEANKKAEFEKKLAIKAFYKKQYNEFMAQGLLIINKNLPTGSFLIDSNKNYKSFNYKPLVEYLNDIMLRIKEKEEQGLFFSLMKAYIYMLCVVNDIIKADLVKKHVIDSTFDGKNKQKVSKNLKAIFNGLKTLEEFINALWILFSNNKNVNDIQKQFIVGINQSGGIVAFLRAQVKKIKSSMQKKDSAAKRFARLTLGAAAIGGGLYVASLILAPVTAVGATTGAVTGATAGTAAGAITLKGVGMSMLLTTSFNVLAGYGEKVIDWLSQADNTEKTWDVLNTNIVGAGVELVTKELLLKQSQKLVNQAFEGITKEKSALLRFSGRLASYAIMNQVQQKVIQGFVKPMSNIIGEEAYNFNLYSYSKNKIVTYLNKINDYLCYDISSPAAINETLLYNDMLQVKTKIKEILLYSTENEKWNMYNKAALEGLERTVRGVITEEGINKKNQRKQDERDRIMLTIGAENPEKYKRTL